MPYGCVRGCSQLFKFLVQGQTRLATYFNFLTVEQRTVGFVARTLWFSVR